MKRFKYPRTFHLSNSPGITSDDKVIMNLKAFEGREVVITEKLDGENTTIYSDRKVHARSIDSNYHSSRSWVQNYASTLDFTSIGPYVRLCGENMYAKHSIHYKELKSYFYLFNTWSEEVCHTWKSTCRDAKELGIETVPVLYEGMFDILILKAIIATLRPDQEGFVMRVTGAINIQEWPTHVAKWVRPNHVQTSKHWMYQKVVKNILKI